jgi:hypothetical protein
MIDARTGFDTGACPDINIVQDSRKPVIDLGYLHKRPQLPGLEPIFM